MARPKKATMTEQNPNNTPDLDGDGDADITPAAPTVTPAPQVIVQMMTPTSGDPTEGLNEAKQGGSYLVPDGAPEVQPNGTLGKQKYKRVNAKGETIK